MSAITCQPAILFVCLGNICRSPLAEAAFRHAAEERGLAAQADSAGTGDYHAGHAPDDRSIAQARRHGIDISAYRARQIETRDFTRFTHILALDADNLRDIRALAPAECSARIGLLMDAVPGHEGACVADPYHGGEEDFRQVWTQVSAAADALAKQLAAERR